MTIKEAWTTIRRELRPVSDHPDLDAERLLLAAVEREDSSWLWTHQEDTVPEIARERWQRWTHERASGRPLAYVLGTWDFYGRRFTVDERVLVPRPDTETVVEQAMAWLSDHPQARVVADIGTGSGVIAITLALELAKSDRIPLTIQLVATDISEDALDVARENARRHGVLDRIEFCQGDMLDPFTGRDIDLIVSNPPYVPTAELDQAGDAKETTGLAFEPRMALDGGEDGQTYVNRLKTAGVSMIIETTGGRIIET